MSERTLFITAIVCFSLLSVAGASSPLPDPVWRTSAGGVITIPPIPTSFGFAACADDKNLYAYTETGVELWHAALPGIPSFLTAAPDDFIYVVTSDKTLCLFNSSGKKLWQTQNSGRQIFAPLAGRDGRVFTFAENTISCYGSAGKKKWTISVKDRIIAPPMEMNDGSLFITLENETIRVSPWGRISQTGIPSEHISSAIHTDEGIVAAYSDGLIVSYAVKNDTVEEIWRIRAQSGRTIVSMFYSEGILLIAGSDNFIYGYNTDTGSVEWGSFNYEINPRQITEITARGESFIILAGSQVIGYTLEGLLRWQYTLPVKPTAVIYTQGGYLVTGASDWILTAYRTDSAVRGFVPKTVLRSYEYARIPYPLFPGNSIRSFLSTVRSEIAAGTVGIEESDYITLLSAVASGNQTINAGIPSLTEQIDALFLLAQLGTYAAQPIFIDILERSINMPVLMGALEAIAMPGYDPESSGLRAIEALLHRIPSTEDAVFLSVCDSVFLICRFMGKPVILSRGKRALLSLLSSEYSIRVNRYATQTLEKLAKEYAR